MNNRIWSVIIITGLLIIIIVMIVTSPWFDLGAKFISRIIDQ